MITEQSVINAQYSAAIDSGLAALDARRPFVLLKPKMYKDGSAWCALYGDNIQDGVCGFGDTPHEASLNFDAAWVGKP